MLLQLKYDTRKLTNVIFHLKNGFNTSAYLRFLFFTFLLPLLFCNYSFAQSCTDTAKKTNYFSVGYKLNLNQHLITAEDEILLSGNYFNIIDTGIFFFKIKADASVSMSKKIHIDDIAPNAFVNDLLKLENGNILLSIGSLAFAGAGDLTFKLIMLNPLGEIIWAKNYTEPGSKGMSIKAFKETPDHDIILMLNFSYSINTYPYENTYYPGAAFIRINNSGSIIWNKLLPFSSKQFEGNSFSIVDNKIYCVGTTQGQLYSVGDELLENNLWAAKIDVNNGKILVYKTYLDLVIQTNTVTNYFNYIFGNLIYCDNGQFTYTDVFRSSDFLNHGLKKVTIDTNLICTNAVYFKFPGGSLNTERILADQKKNIFLYNDEENTIGLNSSFISKFDSTNFQLRQLQIKYADFTKYQSVGLKPIGIKNKYISLINTFVENNDTHLQVFQMPDDVMTSECYGKDTRIVKPLLYNIYEQSKGENYTGVNLDMHSINFAATSTDLPISISDECIIKSTCSNLSITGTDNICSLENTYKFVAHLNGDCLKHVLWRIDTSAVEIMEQLDDSTVNIKFKKNWQGYLTAAINSCSFLKDSIKINVSIAPKLFSLGTDTAICKGEKIILKAPIGYTNFQWQNGSSDSIFTVNQSGSYAVIATDYCNSKYVATIKIVVNELPKINLGNDTTIFINTAIVLRAENGFEKYLWSNGSTNSITSVIAPANVWLQVIDKNNCKVSDSIRIYAKEYPDYIYIPNSFTPNNDGKNDIFKPIVSGNIEAYEFSIYNRYGQQIFHSNRINIGWDGKLKGNQQDVGTFIWTCSYKFKNGKTIFKKGTVLLLR